MNLGKLGVWFDFDGTSSREVAVTAKKIESLGYGTLWIPESPLGKNPMVLASWLLANTQNLIIATGIANIYHREPSVTLAAQNSLAEQSDNRFLLGIGVSHKPIVEGLRGLTYGPPVATMKKYLEQMETATLQMQSDNTNNQIIEAITPPNKPPTVIAALGPKMLALAAKKTQGAHPYFTSPKHTKMAREIMGKDSWLCVEQKVILEENVKKARDLCREKAKFYNKLPNYRNNWLRMGLSEEDIDSLSDKFIDTTFAWGSSKDIGNRVQEHLDAGANHVCIQPINPNQKSRHIHWECVESIVTYLNKENL
jgi:probable F420-dependent oxidoreductase